MKELTDSDLAAWDTKWRAFLASRPVAPLPPSWSLGPQPGMHDIRDRARLAELLLARNHAADSVTELEPIPVASWDDASLRHLRARAFESAGNLAVVEASLGEPKDVVSSYGPWWAIRGRFARARGDAAGTGGAHDADGFFEEAVSQDPLDVECACESLDPAFSPASPAPRALCDAARKRDEPSIGGD
jgi:hypothetical protein